MLGYCGINCTECSAYKATVTTDKELMQHVQDTFGDGKGTLRDWVCLGCLSAEPAFMAKYCENCKIPKDPHPDDGNYVTTHIDKFGRKCAVCHPGGVEQIHKLGR